MLCDESATLEDRHIMDELTEKIEKARDNIVLDERFGCDAVDEDDDMREHSADDTQRVMPFLPLQFSAPYMAVVILIITQL